MNQYIDLWDKEWLYQWIKAHCKSKEIIDKERNEALSNAEPIIKQKFDNVEITTEPITFYASEFSTNLAFALAMKNVSLTYKDSKDVIVRYAKPEDKETKEVRTCFQVLKSKSKAFYNYMLETDKIFEFSLSSGGDIKHCIKLLNSLGVKNEEGEHLSSKEKDTAKEIKETLATLNGGKVYCDLKLNKDNGTLCFDWYVTLDKQDETLDYQTFKEKIEEILK